MAEPDGKPADFSEHLLTKKGHDTVVALNENEIKQLENMRAYMAKRAKIDQDYGQSLSKISLSAINQCTTDSDRQSPVEAAWLSYLKESENKAKLMVSKAKTISASTVNRLDVLIREKKDLLSKYQKDRMRMDSEYNRECDDIERLKKSYKDSAKEAVNAKAKYEKIVNKGKTEGQDWKNARDKYCRTTLKLHQNHNEYVLALIGTCCHQDFYFKEILPTLMKSVQACQEQYIAEWKDVFLEIFNYTNFSSEEFVDASARVLENVNIIEPEKEYVEFVSRNMSEDTEKKDFEFDATLIENAKNCGKLEASKLVLNDLTLEKIQHRATLLSQDAEKWSAKVNEKQSDLSTAESAASEEGLKRISKIQKDLAVFQALRELKETTCTFEKIERKHTAASELLNLLGSNDPPVFDEKLDITKPNKPPPVTNSNGKSSSLKKPGKRPKMSGKTTSLPANLSLDAYSNEENGPRVDDDDDAEQRGEYIEPVISIEEEDFFHGQMDRDQATVVLMNDGDYLIRESKGKYVLSARSHGDFKHFIIQKQDNLYRFEGEGFPTIQSLINYHVNEKAPVTKRSNTILLRATKRRDRLDEFSILHSDVLIQDKLGQGHFGDVTKGFLKSRNIPVAVKMCKTNVQPQVKEKFLAEGELLKDYKHPNIVTLYGICSDKEPYYIVMEFMPGGDFLNYLRKQGNTLSTKQLTKMSIDAAAGMAYLAEKNCIHRDLAARNCLVGENCQLKISDFGMSRLEDEEGCYNATNMREIPVKWTAPEALNYAHYTAKSDVWSFGILLWETFSLGNSPYPGMTNRDTREKVEQGYRMPPPNGTPPHLYQIMMDCWSFDPQLRPTFDEIHRRLIQVEAQIRG